ncbi:TPA: sortase, partial [Burkholderia cenocepacia]
RFDNRSGATPLTGQGPWIESPCVSRCYASDLMDIHRLANKICGQLAIDCVAGVEDPPECDRGTKPVRKGCPRRAPAR